MNRQFNCIQCGIDFVSDKFCKSRLPKFCSRKCAGLSVRINKPCQACGDTIPSNGKNNITIRKFCSKKCQSDARKGVPLSQEWKIALSDGRKASPLTKGSFLYNWKGGKDNTYRKNKIKYHQRRSLGKLDFKYLALLLMAQKGKCFYCDCDIRAKGAKAVEHLQPISKGGTNEWSNIVYSCKSCNSKKHDKTLLEFSIQNYRFDWLNNNAQLVANELLVKYGDRIELVGSQRRTNTRTAKQSKNIEGSQLCQAG